MPTKKLCRNDVTTMTPRDNGFTIKLAFQCFCATLGRGSQKVKHIQEKKHTNTRWLSQTGWVHKYILYLI